MTDRSAVVLAGGHSTRYGEGDKTIATLDGRPLIAHAVEPLRSVVDTVVVSCREEQVQQFRTVLDGVQYRPDETPDRGPLAGLADALEAIETETVAVATADMPCVPAGLYQDLFERLDRGRTAAVATTDAGYCQPAPAVFRTEQLRTVAGESLADGDRRLRAVVTALDITEVAAATVTEGYGQDVFADVNTVADRRTLE